MTMFKPVDAEVHVERSLEFHTTPISVGDPQNPIAPPANMGFGMRVGADGFWLSAPYWFLSLVCALAAILPRVACRFSLRTMLLATTVVAVVLGLVGYTVR